jgi:hypothetical protein
VVTADKLEAFRKRREQTEAVTPIPEATEVFTEVEAEVTLIEYSIEEDPEDELEGVGEESQVSSEQPAPESKKSRPPMPSWDEIVRGTQSDDGEVF